VISALLALPALPFRPLGGRLAPKCAQGEVVVVRYANDIILGFQYQTDADRSLENLREGLAMVWTGVETTGNFLAAIPSTSSETLASIRAKRLGTPFVLTFRSC
jgi:hypothetical protein